jgi:hypothetical protein
MQGLLIALLMSSVRPALAEDPYAWTMPSAEQQLAADETTIPIGKGAVFVPSITGPEHEPPARLVTEDEIVSVSVGQRFIVDPGPYVVIISSGTPQQGMSVAIEVVEGETAVVPVDWGALRIEVTDDHRIPHRGVYELIRADTLQPVGTGFGVDTLQGEILQTWLLPPGIYRIVRPGRSSRALRDFATVVIPESSFVRYRLVMDEDTGEFLGSGVLLPSEFATDGPRARRWFRSIVAGIDGSSVASSNVVGAFNQTQYNAAAYFDAQFKFNGDPHNLSLLLQLDEGFSRVLPQGAKPQPRIKSIDRIRADVLYTFTRQGSTGPYARFSADSQAFATEVLVTGDTTFSVTGLDGEVTTQAVSSNETFRLSGPGTPTLMREGIGVNSSWLEKNRSMNFNWRGGFGMRQNIYAGTLVLDDDAATDALEYVVIDSFYQAGLESTMTASARLPGFGLYSTDLELFLPFSSLTKPAASWRNTVSVRVTRNFSVNLFANLDLEPQVIDELQVQTSVFFRTSWNLL